MKGLWPLASPCSSLLGVHLAAPWHHPTPGLDAPVPGAFALQDPAFALCFHRSQNENLKGRDGS